ncbi:hypothetical protein EXIGLDRAFT_771231 [Exidia glandulosa HHB12029]|uniref:F-box domain-containing protein n=1 Tax=Exidia glandulosa HHB12029 TaxID=1314781 RepID=A0A165G5X5_EXIGL|nr:hypothetical protein EXIGLDRAFT_771231 [Exidia glandulosa HHB12029]
MSTSTTISSPATTQQPLTAYEAVTDHRRIHSMLLSNGPHKGTGIRRDDGLQFLERIREYYRKRAASPDDGRFEMPFTLWIAKFMFMLGPLGELLRHVRFALDQDAVASYGPRDPDMSPVWHDPLRPGEPDWDSDDDFEANDALVQDGRIGADVYTYSMDDERVLYETYDKIGLYGVYPLQDFLSRIYRTFRSIIKHGEPKFQRILITTMPFELNDMIVGYLGKKDRQSLGLTSSFFRDLCAATTQEGAKFVQRHDHSVVRTGIQAGLPESQSVYHSMLASVASLVESIDRFLANSGYLGNLRYASFVNQWIDLFPGFIREPTASLLDMSVYRPLSEALALLLVSSNLRSLDLRGFGLTYEILDGIASSSTLRKLHIDRCFPVIAHKEGMVYVHMRKRVIPHQGTVMVERTRLHASFVSLATLSIGFGPEYDVAQRNWNIVSLCPSLEDLYCYSSHLDRAYEYPSPMLWPSVNLARLKRVNLEGCSSAFSMFIAGCRKGAERTDTKGGWERLKLRTYLPISNEDFGPLMDYIALYQPDLRVLILEGLRVLPAHTITVIAKACPSLDCLAVSRRARDNSLVNDVCLWDERIEAYASAVSNFASLRHLTVNMLWFPHPMISPATSPLPSPLPTDPDHEYSTIDLDAAYALHSQPTYNVTIDPDLLEDVPTWYDSVLRPPPIRIIDHRRWDPINMAYEFQHATPTLRSFAIRGETTHVRTVIESDDYGRDSGAFIIVEDPQNDLFHNSWNPPYGSTWSHE